MIELEFNTDNTQIGYRLDYLELLNWGTFHNQIWQISPNGNNSLLTGGIGTGKSTIVDALTCLLVPHNKIIFNKAAGAGGKERDLPSYIRGEYKNTKDEYSDLTEQRKGKPVSLRYNSDNDITYTVILGNFHNMGYSSNCSLVQVFWIENGKVQKLFVISTNALRIKEIFENIEDARTLRQRIKKMSNIEYIGENFSEYSKKFMRLFGMNSAKAIDLFYQTVSMKSVSSLTSFVREHMLEETDVKDKIDELKKRFNDLNKAHDAVKKVREQRDKLFPLVELNNNYKAYNQQITELGNIIDTIPNYFAVKKITLLETEIKSCEAKLNQLENQLHEIDRNLKDKISAKNQIEQDIDTNGGTRLKEIANEINQREKTKIEKNNRHKTYVNLLSLCMLPIANTDRCFYSNLKTVQKKIEKLKEIYITNTEKLGELTANLSNAKENIEKAETELHSLKQRKNQIPSELLYVRQKMITELEIDEKEIPFAGELIKVKDEHWEGALERLLRNFGISLLVPEKHYSTVSGYINTKTLLDKNHRGIRLDYFPVPQKFKSKNQYGEIHVDSVINKIEIKSNTYFEDWLQSDIEQHFNLLCVSVEDFKKIRHDAITIEGQFRRGKKHTKDDRRGLWDRTKFVLGWSNLEKIKAIEHNLEKDLIPIYNNILKSLDNLKNEIAENATLNNNLNQLLAYQTWNELNWHDEVKKIEELNREKFDIETSNDVLKLLQENLTKIAEEIIHLEGERTSKTKNIGGIEENIKEYNEKIIICKTAVDTVFKIEVDVYYPKIDELIKETILTHKNVDNISNALKSKLDNEKENLSKNIQVSRERIISVMQEYRYMFPSETQELSATIDFLPEFINDYDKIVNEGLPEHENRFKEMLNKNTIEDIRVFDVKLNAHSKQIKSKIHEINKHLKEIEFNKGTYIELSADSAFDKEINEFKKDLRNCYADVFDYTIDAYTEERFNMVKKFLDRFMSNENKDIDWTKKVTDVRNWFLFSASERYKEDDYEKEYFADSAGKSGGQKEKLAYTILAAALTYQFGLAYGEPRSKSFRFVTIDEAFGRGDDESTQFGLELFKKLNLQLLVITPFQKIHIIENYINTVHIVSNPEGNNSEIEYLTKKEYMEKKQQRNLINIIQETEQ